MFNNSSHIDASHSTFSDVHRDQYFTSHPNVQGNQTINTIIHGNQIVQSPQIGLEALQKVSTPSAAFDSAERHPAPRCLEGTRIQLLDRLTQWANNEDGNDSERRLCWVNGRPGSGKSAVSQSIAEKFADQKRLAASFFFSRRDIQRRTTRHFFPTIATQFFHSVPAIRPAILAALDEDSMIPSKVLQEQMHKLLSEPLSHFFAHTGPPLLVIVDALDECDDPRTVVELVSLLVQLVRSSPLPLRLLITSRPEPWLQAQFRQPDTASATLPLEIELFTVEGDIRSFLQHALKQVRQEHVQVMADLQWPSPEDIDRIVEKASGLFIFALTVVKFVGDRLHNPVQRLRAILEDKPSRDSAYSDLDALYRDAVSTFPDADIVRLVLGVVYSLSVPMTVAALHLLLDRQNFDVRLVIPALSSVLLSSENDKQPIQFYHASFRDFLISPQRSRKYTIDPVVYHRLMASLCFKIIVQKMKRNMCRLDDPSKLNRNVEDLTERRQTAYGEALLYACRYWSHHLTQLPTQGGVYESVLNAMHEFCSKRLLYWIETASIFDDVENAIIMLRDALNWLKSLTKVPRATAALVEDAERLVLLFRQPISQSAPHVYHTAITLAPLSCALYANFKRDTGDSYAILQGQDGEWQAYQYAIDLSSLTSVAFSPNGSILATASENQGVQLWNVVTGGNVASLGDKAKSSILVRFSTSGFFIAAAFTDGAVAVWDPNLGREHLKDTGVHTDKITCLEFSPDSSLLASGSLDRTIQLWSLDSAQRLHRLEAHEGPVTALVFTPDSGRLCSGSEDNLVIAWDVKLGKAVRVMTGHRASITALDVSRSGTMVVSGSQDKSVKIWDLQSASGSCTRTLSKGHKYAIGSVHFFDDDKRFISASNGTVLSSSVSTRKSSSDVSIWDLGQNVQAAMGNAPIWQAKVLGRGLPTFLLRKMMEGEDGASNEQLLVAYSSQSPVFAFSYLAESWAATLGSRVEAPSIHVSQAYLTSLALSPDGTRLAAGSFIGSLDILDTTVPPRKWEEDLKRDLGVPLRLASIVVPSPDGARFLANSALSWYLTDDNFRLLTKIDFGIATYARADDAVPQPVFSADSSTFAWSILSGIFDNYCTVRVFDSTTGTQKVRFGKVKQLQAFVLSPNGNLIGCGHKGALTVCDVGMQAKREMAVTCDSEISITALAFSSDSQTLLSGSENGVLQLWDPLSGACKMAVENDEFTSSITNVGFAPDGDMVVMVHKDGTVRLVSLTTSASHLLCPSETEFTSNVRAVFFLQDARGWQLVCKTGENEVSFWAVPPELFAPSVAEEVQGEEEQGEGQEQEEQEEQEEQDEQGEGQEQGEQGERGQEEQEEQEEQGEQQEQQEEIQQQEKNTREDQDQGDQEGEEAENHEDGVVHVRCPICDQWRGPEKTEETEETAPEESPSPKGEKKNEDETDAPSADSPPLSLPHLVSKHNGDRVFDTLFRTPYVIRKDGWVCKMCGDGLSSGENGGDKEREDPDTDERLFWLPQHLRPLRNDPQFTAFNGKIMILTHNRRVLFLTLR